MGSAVLALQNFSENFKEPQRREKIDGKWVAMSPMPRVNHNRGVVNVCRILDRHFRGCKCELFADGIDVHLSAEHTFVPDAVVVCDPDKIKRDGIYGTPDLVVEILSPRTLKYDRGRKKDVYEESGVREYWIIDTEFARGGSIEVYILIEGKFKLYGAFPIYFPYEYEHLKQEEKDELVHEFTSPTFPDLHVQLAELFERIV